MAHSAPKAPWALITILGVIGALVIAALAVVLTHSEPTRLDASSPVGVVQRYSAAAISGDSSTAISYLTTRAITDCVHVMPPAALNLSVALVSTSEGTDSAEVTVMIADSTGNGPFGSPQSEYSDVFGLLKTEHGWMIDSTPWLLTVCPPGGAER